MPAVLIAPDNDQAGALYGDRVEQDVIRRLADQLRIEQDLTSRVRRAHTGVALVCHEIVGEGGGRRCDRDEPGFLLAHQLADIPGRSAGIDNILRDRFTHCTYADDCRLLLETPP